MLRRSRVPLAARVVVVTALIGVLADRDTSETEDGSPQGQKAAQQDLLPEDRQKGDDGEASAAAAGDSTPALATPTAGKFLAARRPAQDVAGIAATSAAPGAGSLAQRSGLRGEAEVLGGSVVDELAASLQSGSPVPAAAALELPPGVLREVEIAAHGGPAPAAEADASAASAMLLWAAGDASSAMATPPALESQSASRGRLRRRRHGESPASLGLLDLTPAPTGLGSGETKAPDAQKNFRNLSTTQECELLTTNNACSEWEQKIAKRLSTGHTRSMDCKRFGPAEAVECVIQVSSVKLGSCKCKPGYCQSLEACRLMGSLKQVMCIAGACDKGFECRNGYCKAAFAGWDDADFAEHFSEKKDRVNGRLIENKDLREVACTHSRQCATGDCLNRNNAKLEESDKFGTAVPVSLNTDANAPQKYAYGVCKADLEKAQEAKALLLQFTCEDVVTRHWRSKVDDKILQNLGVRRIDEAENLRQETCQAKDFRNTLDTSIGYTVPADIASFWSKLARAHGEITTQQQVEYIKALEMIKRLDGVQENLLKEMCKDRISGDTLKSDSHADSRADYCTCSSTSVDGASDGNFFLGTSIKESFPGALTGNLCDATQKNLRSLSREQVAFQFLYYGTDVSDALSAAVTLTPSCKCATDYVLDAADEAVKIGDLVAFDVVVCRIKKFQKPEPDARNQFSFYWVDGKEALLEPPGDATKNDPCRTSVKCEKAKTGNGIWRCPGIKKSSAVVFQTFRAMVNKVNDALANKLMQSLKDSLLGWSDGMKEAGREVDEVDKEVDAITKVFTNPQTTSDELMNILHTSGFGRQASENIYGLYSRWGACRTYTPEKLTTAAEVRQALSVIWAEPKKPPIHLSQEAFRMRNWDDDEVHRNLDCGMVIIYIDLAIMLFWTVVLMFPEKGTFQKMESIQMDDITDKDTSTVIKASPTRKPKRGAIY